MAAFLHTNLNVLDLDKSLAFYRQALGLREARRVVPEDGSFVIVFLEDGHTGYQLELTWLRDRREPYNLGDNEFHLAFRVEDKAAAHDLHESMGCICYENPAMDLYCIEDPDGYWLEILDREKSPPAHSSGRAFHLPGTDNGAPAEKQERPTGGKQQQ